MTHQIVVFLCFCFGIRLQCVCVCTCVCACMRARACVCVCVCVCVRACVRASFAVLESRPVELAGYIFRPKYTTNDKVHAFL